MTVKMMSDFCKHVVLKASNFVQIERKNEGVIWL